jgi:hypothetical protein
MPNQVQRSIRDALFTVADFALPAAASSSTTSAVVDLAADSWKPAQLDFLLTIPALSTTIAPDTRTVTAIIETSTTSNFSAVDATIFSRILTGAGGAGIAAQTALTCRPPANCARYVRAKVTFGASTTDGSAVSASFGPRF